MKTSELLTKAKERINTPEKWCKGASWRRKDGQPAIALSEIHSCCGYGAISAVALTENVPMGIAASAIEESAGTSYFDHWNDAPERTHDEVMAAFDRAIAIALEKEAQ